MSTIADKYKSFCADLRGRKLVDAKAGHFRDASEEELKAAGVIESLCFQLDCRIDAARTGSPCSPHGKPGCELCYKV